jgi:hypothetical protein
MLPERLAEGVVFARVREALNLQRRARPRVFLIFHVAPKPAKRRLV